MRVLAFELVGTPFGYHKFRGGFSVEFVGFQMRYDTKEVGSQLSVGDWLRDWIIKAERKGMWWSHVTSRRLGFVFQLLVLDETSPVTAICLVSCNRVQHYCKVAGHGHFDPQMYSAELQVESYMVSAARPQTARVSSFAR